MNRNELITWIVIGIVLVIWVGIAAWTLDFAYDVFTLLRNTLG